MAGAAHVTYAETIPAIRPNGVTWMSRGIVNYQTERKTPDFSPGDGSESVLFVVYLFYTVGPTGIDACGAAVITKLPTLV